MSQGFQPPRAPLAIARMLNYHTPHVGLPSSMPPKSPVANLAHIKRADGGGIPDSPDNPIHGALIGTSPGRADDVKTHVPSGAYVIPAWSVAHLGQGNSLAGMSVLKHMFGAPLSQEGAKANSPFNGPPGPQGRGKGMGIPKALPPQNFPAFPQMGQGMPKMNSQMVPGRADGGKAESRIRNMQILDQLQNMQAGDSHKTIYNDTDAVDGQATQGVTNGMVNGFGPAFPPAVPDDDMSQWGYNAPQNKYKNEQGLAGGGAAKGTPVMLSDGEFVIHPEEVARRGGGDIDKGHRVLDTWLRKMKTDAANTLRKLPGPAR